MCFNDESNTRVTVNSARCPTIQNGITQDTNSITVGTLINNFILYLFMYLWIVNNSSILTFTTFFKLNSKPYTDHWKGGFVHYMAPDEFSFS